MPRRSPQRSDRVNDAVDYPECTPGKAWHVKRTVDMTIDLDGCPDESGRADVAASTSCQEGNLIGRYGDLLSPLSPRQRNGLIARLSVGYFEGWRPSRREVAEVVAEESRRHLP